MSTTTRIIKKQKPINKNIISEDAYIDYSIMRDGMIKEMNSMKLTIVNIKKLPLHKKYLTKLEFLIFSFIANDGEMSSMF